MRFVEHSTVCNVVLLVAAGAAAHDQSRSWAGTSSYFVQGLSDTAAGDYISALARNGAKVIRTWVNHEAGNGVCVKGSPSEKVVPEFESAIGQYNYATLDALDEVLVKVGKHDMKAIISIHDANLFAYPSGQHANASDAGPNGNGCDAYCSAYGGDQNSSDNFYLSPEAQRQFDDRISAILNYRGKYSDRVWSRWPEVILSFDIQNEPQILSQDLCRSGTNTWLCDRGRHMRNLLGHGNPTQVSTGGIGGDVSNNCTFSQPSLSCPFIDIISVHRYADTSDWTSAAEQYLSIVESADTSGHAGGHPASRKTKLLQIEEFGVYPSYKNGFDMQTSDINAAGIPWTYWEIVPPRDTGPDGCPIDGDMFTFYFDQSKGNVQAAFEGARNATAAQDWNRLVW